MGAEAASGIDPLPRSRLFAVSPTSAVRGRKKFSSERGPRVARVFSKRARKHDVVPTFGTCGARRERLSCARGGVEEADAVGSAAPGSAQERQAAHLLHLGAGAAAWRQGGAGNRRAGGGALRRWPRACPAAGASDQRHRPTARTV